MNFAQALKKAMAEKGVTAYRLSKDLGVHQTTISNWLNGKSAPRMRIVHRISQVLGVQIDDLLGIAPLQPKEEHTADEVQRIKKIFGHDVTIQELNQMDVRDQESTALWGFLGEIGYISFFSTERPNHPIRAIIDKRNGEIYQVSMQEQNILEKSVTDFAKFQLYELFKKNGPVTDPEVRKYIEYCMDNWGEETDDDT